MAWATWADLGMSHPSCRHESWLQPPDDTGRGVPQRTRGVHAHHWLGNLYQRGGMSHGMSRLTTRAGGAPEGTWGTHHRLTHESSLHGVP